MQAKKKSFVDELQESMGTAEVARRQAQAAETFAREAPELPAEVLPIRVEDLAENPRNPRQSLGDLTELVASIAAAGVLSPLLVRSTHGKATAYQVVSGHRRLAAARKAGLESVPCIIIDADEVQALELNLTEQLQRSQLSPLEEGLACRSLQEISGYSVDQVARKLGQSPSWVSKRVALTGLAPELQTALKKGELQLTVAQAIAVLPSHQAQVTAWERVQPPSWQQSRTAEELVDVLRTEVCRPLKGAPWKLTDELLVPEAGACSACPHNSANDKMPGLFDAGGKTKAPSCANPSCFDGKVAAAWEAKTAKASAAGAKVLSVEEGKKLFGYGDNLPYGSRYVEASAIAQEDRSKRSWAQLLAEVPEDHRPQLHVAQDPAGKARELYVQDKALKAVAQHLGLKWAQKQEAATSTRAKAADPKKRADEERRREVAEAVTEEAINVIAKRASETGINLNELRYIADAFLWEAEAFGKAIGQKVTKAWLMKEASTKQLEAFNLFIQMRESRSSYDSVDEKIAELAQFRGFDAVAVAKERLAAEKKAEPEKAKKGGAK